MVLCHVSYAKLLHCLRQFRFGGNILEWFRSYLINRRQRTTIFGTKSKSLPVTSGVSQGSILGPLLFLLYEDHLSNAVRTSNIATFADDTKTFKTINSYSDTLALQADLTSVEESSKNFNPKMPLDDEYWQCFMLLLEITDIVFSLTISLDLLGVFEALIQEYLWNFSHIYPGRSIIPKMHYLVHCPSHIFR